MTQNYSFCNIPSALCASHEFLNINEQFSEKIGENWIHVVIWQILAFISGLVTIIIVSCPINTLNNNNPKVTTNLKKVCTQNNMYVVFTNNLKIINLLNSGKDKTPVTRQRDVYEIPCDCGKFYVERTHQNLRNANNSIKMISLKL